MGGDDDHTVGSGRRHSRIGLFLAGANPEADGVSPLQRAEDRTACHDPGALPRCRWPGSQKRTGQTLRFSYRMADQSSPSPPLSTGNRKSGRLSVSPPSSTCCPERFCRVRFQAAARAATIGLFGPTDAGIYAPAVRRLRAAPGQSVLRPEKMARLSRSAMDLADVRRR
jgi:hypothetical protein